MADRPSYLPDGYHAVTIYLTSQRATELVDFVKAAFAATELLRMGGAGGLHVEVKIGDSRLMIGGGQHITPGSEKHAALHLYVEDADAIYRRAIEAGATSLYAPVDQDYGDREGGVKDPFGNTWYIATHKQKSAASGHIPEGLHTITPYLHARGAAKLSAFLQEAFAAKELYRGQAPDGFINHAKLRIGDSAVELSEARGDFQPLPTMFYVYVADVDASYRRALAAGATSLNEPADQSYGDRRAAVTDAFGNDWYMAAPLRAAVAKS
jgi:PhnB protein